MIISSTICPWLQFQSNTESTKMLYCSNFSSVSYDLHQWKFSSFRYFTPLTKNRSASDNSMMHAKACIDSYLRIWYTCSNVFLCLSHIYLHICVFKLFLEDECHWKKYQNISDGQRKHDYVTTSAKCDNDLDGWYRFQGAAGTKMVTTCPPLKRCGADFPIYMSGTHPTVAEGRVTILACIHKQRCCDGPVSIEVKNCGSYYIYKLGNPKQCPARYCTTD